ncbi:Smr/MutS family protein [[Clostridium] symbiosum]|uniref:Smr/MutS family protein n=1 Tax=Clostridium symbiosum TaxID=1512 RepID=UPI001D08AEF8|nr:Smr/MutS family protein [[Clostridium] symbiosum]MCB6609906.1 Smr/MutS family protein [[Clostridium] symbiosum]MCB6932045.1 Smr/MutS family protein [[Clostridium] symbiosum]
MNGGIIELDLHGRRAEEAKRLIDAELDRAGRNVYRIRLIHGFHGGTGIKNMIWEEYSYGREPRVVRLEHGMNQGITELVLREY